MFLCGSFQYFWIVKFQVLYNIIILCLFVLYVFARLNRIKKKNPPGVYWMHYNTFEYIPSLSKFAPSMSLTISSVTSTVCSLHVSPLSDLRTTISLSHPRSDPKFGTSIMTGLLRDNSNSNKINRIQSTFRRCRIVSCKTVP